MTSKIKRIHAALLADAPHLKDKAFHYSEGNEFGDASDFLFDTPHGYWGAPSDVLPARHSQRFLEAYSSILNDVRQSIDIVNLGEISGEFRRRLFSGIKESLYRTGNHLTVRIFFGLPLDQAMKPWSIDTRKFLADMKEAIGYADTLSVYVGVATRLDPSSVLPWTPVTGGWNHSKFVAVDSRQLLVGGHNWLGDEAPYLGDNPVFDLSIRLNGSAAHAALAFSNYLWAYIRRNNSHAPESRVWCHSMIRGHIETHVPPEVEYRPVEQNLGSATVLAVGQPGLSALDNPRHNSPSLLAAYVAIEQAERVIHLSQQNLGMGPGSYLSHPSEFRHALTCGSVPITSVGRFMRGDPRGEFWYDRTLFTQLARALARNVQVNVVTTNAGAGHYSTGETVGHVYRAFGHFLVRHCSRTLEEARALIKANLRFKTIMSHGHIPWTYGNKSIKANHAKFWAVDDELFYVGSHNLYPSVILRGFNAHHDEWGVVVSGQPETKRIMDGYFTPLFAHGFPTAFKDEYLDGVT